MGSSRDPSRTKNGGYIEEENIPESHLAAELRHSFSLRMRQMYPSTLKQIKEIPASMQPGFQAYQNRFRLPIAAASTPRLRLRPNRRATAGAAMENQSAGEPPYSACCCCFRSQPKRLANQCLAPEKHWRFGKQPREAALQLYGVAGRPSGSEALTGLQADTGRFAAASVV